MPQARSKASGSNTVDQLRPPAWSREKFRFEIDPQTRIAELQRILDAKAYAPEEQRPNIEMTIELYQSGVLPWPPGELVFIQDEELFIRPNLFPGASCYWAEGTMPMGGQDFATPLNIPGKLHYQPVDFSTLAEPKDDQERARMEEFMKQLASKGLEHSYFDSRRGWGRVTRSSNLSQRYVP